MTSTIVLVLVVLNLVLVALGLLAWRLFRSDPNPTVSDSLGVPRVARVSGIVGTLSDGSKSGQGKSLVAASVAPTHSASSPVSAPASTAGFASAELDLPGLFAIDTGVPNPSTSAIAD